MQFSVYAASEHHGRGLAPSFLSTARHVTRKQKPIEMLKVIINVGLRKSLTCHETPNFDISRPESPSVILAMSEHTAT